jgi:hypothetical protein
VYDEIDDEVLDLLKTLYTRNDPQIEWHLMNSVGEE